MYVLRYYYSKIETDNRNLINTYINPTEILIDVPTLKTPIHLTIYANYLSTHLIGTVYKIFIRFEIETDNSDNSTIINTYAFDENLYYTRLKTDIDEKYNEYQSSQNQDQWEAVDFETLKLQSYSNTVNYLNELIHINSKQSKLPVKIKIYIYLPNGHTYTIDKYKTVDNGIFLKEIKAIDSASQSYTEITEYDNTLQSVDNINTIKEEIAEMFEGTKYELKGVKYTPDTHFLIETKPEEEENYGTMIKIYSKIKTLYDGKIKISKVKF